MPIAAVPRYLGNDFTDASPGMRFGMYLKLWGVNRRSQVSLWTTHDMGYEVRGQTREEREVKYENKVSALVEAKRLGDNDKKMISALIDRQERSFAIASTVGNMLRIDAIAIAPFTTGLGSEHPLENGFAFLNPYGLAYLPGSGVKGVLRQAARELASSGWGETRGWSDKKAFILAPGKEKIPLSVIDVLFGLESSDGDTTHVRGALSFWDVIPRVKGDSLMVEIMTPHQAHYYQQNKDRKTGDSISPHDSGQPTPIFFLTVPPGSEFRFIVTCDVAHLSRLTAVRADGAPHPLAERDTQWKTLLDAAFQHAFQWLGFGAKTAVGYGALREPTEKEQADRRQQDAEQAAAAQRCGWVDDMIAKIAKKNIAKPDEVLRGKALAEAWAALTDADLKKRALDDIRFRWERQKDNWWNSPPPGTAKKAKAIYCGE